MSNRVTLTEAGLAYQRELENLRNFSPKKYNNKYEDSKDFSNHKRSINLTNFYGQNSIETLQNRTLEILNQSKDQNVIKKKFYFIFFYFI